MITPVIAEHDNQPIKAAALNTVTAVAQCGDDVHVLVAGAGYGAAAQAAVWIADVTEMLVADMPQFTDGLVKNVAEQTLTATGNYNHILAPATAYNESILPRVATKLDAVQLSDITKVDDPGTFEYPIYAGNVTATVQSVDKVKVITVRDTTLDPAAVTGGVTATENPTAVMDASISRFVSREVMKGGRPRLTVAKIIVSDDHGVRSGESYTKVLMPLADKLSAALGASYVTVDADFVPNDYQVGQTGKIVAPQLCITVGISDATQHLAGTKDSKVIVTISKGPEAPIFQVADYSLVGDLSAVASELVITLGQLHRTMCPG